jgi:hypothetical protein
VAGGRFFLIQHHPWIEDGLLNAMYLRDRHSILRFAHEQGWLDEITQEIMAEELA